jgi:hypothetical protein
LRWEIYFPKLYLQTPLFWKDPLLFDAKVAQIPPGNQVYFPGFGQALPSGPRNPAARELKTPGQYHPVVVDQVKSEGAVFLGIGIAESNSAGEFHPHALTDKVFGSVDKSRIRAVISTPSSHYPAVLCLG